MGGICDVCAEVEVKTEVVVGKVGSGVYGGGREREKVGVWEEAEAAAAAAVVVVVVEEDWVAF